MRRDLDLVRRLLLRIESGHNLTSSDLAEDDFIDAEWPTVTYHLRMIIGEAGLARGNESARIGDEDHEEWDDIELTWSGHDFLDQVRDDEIWRLTKEGASKAKGFTFDLLASLARGLIKEKIKKHTGVEVDL